jgi:diguanylate cyclase (GGDEF)-like protein/PAS domain S-box-containing protein
MIPFVIPLFISAIITGGLAWYSSSLRGVPGLRYFRLSLLLTSFWSLSYAVELLLPTFSSKVVASNLAYTAIAGLPLAWLATVMNYTNNGKHFSRLFPLLVIIPFFTILFVWVQPLRHFLIQKVNLDTNGAFPILRMDYGSWFWVHTAFSYGILIIAAAFLIGLLVRTPRRYIGQPLTLLMGMLIPLIWNVIYIFRIVPFRRLDLTPYLYSLSGLIFLIGLSYSRLFDILPVARDVVMDAMSDAVIVTDYQGRVVDMNLAACRIFGWRNEHALISQRIEKIFAEWPTIVGLLNADKPRPVELVLELGERQFHYQVSLAPVQDMQGYSLGRMLLLHDITDRKYMEEELRRLSVTDPLTGLGNRRKFFNALESEFARARRYHSDYCLIMADLDHYKSINDRFSHMTGDEALKLTAEAIQKTARKTDVAARYGGDEFVLLLPNTQVEGALQLASRLREAISRCELSVGEHLTVSIGVAVYFSMDKNSEDLLVRADRALYQAKKDPRGIVVAENPQAGE